MIYIDSFRFPGVEAEEQYVNYIERNCYSSFYPFGVFANNQLSSLSFSEITILYGNNGSGKSTALNIMAEKLKAKRDSLFNRSSFFGKYLAMCDYEELKKVVAARSKTQSRYVREAIGSNVITHSNGESALQYFSEKIKDNGLYLLDEPENSLSPERQIELLEFIQNSARFFGCQFIIATHSPFLLALKGARIYDLDECPVDIKRWTELDGVRTYFDFFEKHREEF